VARAAPRSSPGAGRPSAGAVENRQVQAGEPFRVGEEVHFGDRLPDAGLGERGRRRRAGSLASDQLTDAGRQELARWIATPVPGARLKDEFFMKFAVATSVGLADPMTLIERQRLEYLQSLRDLDAASSAHGKGPAAQLLVEGAILHLKADLEWLDLIESRLTQWEKVG
jgi:hypothetical protein